MTWGKKYFLAGKIVLEKYIVHDIINHKWCFCGRFLI